MKITKIRKRKNIRKSKKSINNQQGGMTFLNGIYAFFCNNYETPNLSKKFDANENAPKLSEITKELSFKGWSYKVFAPSTFGRKQQGDKLNLVVDSSISNDIIRFFDKIENVDDALQREDSYKTFFWNASKFLAKSPLYALELALNLAGASLKLGEAIFFTVMSLFYIDKERWSHVLDASVDLSRSESSLERSFDQRMSRNRLETVKNNIPTIIRLPPDLNKPTINASGKNLISNTFGAQIDADSLQTFATTILEMMSVNKNNIKSVAGYSIDTCYIIEINSFGKNTFLKKIHI